MSQKRTLAILNLSGEFPTELANYFSSREIAVINPLTDKTVLDWTHIFTRDVDDFSVIEQTYQTNLKDIQIISLSKVQDLRGFILSGGKMVFDERWLAGTIGNFILDKFFQEFGGINIEDSYPNFQEVGSFNVINPFSTGEYLDRLVFNAFERNINALAIKTYFDHLIMYLSGLKTKGRVGMPIEISYGTLNDVFGVQMNFFADGLTVDDITMCLSSAITKRPEEYLLNIAVQSADFFDFTFLSSVNKVVITGLWSNDPEIRMENRGLMFTDLSPAAKIGGYPTQVAEAFVIHDDKIEDMSDKIIIPEREAVAVEEEVLIEEKAAPEEEQVTVIGPSAPEEEAVTKVSGGDEEDDSSQLVKGSKEQKDKTEKRFGPDKEETDNFAQKVGGDKKEKDNSSQKIGGDKKEKDNFSQKIGSGSDEEEKGGFNVKTSGNGSDKKPGQLGVKSLGNSTDGMKPGEFEFKTFGSDDSAPEKQSKMEVKSLGNAAQSNSNSNPMFKTSSGNSEKEKKLAEDLKAALNENERMKMKLKLMATEMDTMKNNRAKLNDLSLKSAEIDKEEKAIKGSSDDDELRKQFQDKLSESKQLNPQEMAKLNKLLERESKLIEESKANQLIVKKMQLEMAQKENFLTQELEKAQRLVASKEMIAVKTKETLTKMLEKKDEEITAMKNRIEAVSKTLASGPSTSQVTQIKDLEKQNTNLNKIVENYKNKITSLSEALDKSKADDTSKEDARRASMMSAQFKNMAETARKELDKLKEKSNHDLITIGNLRQEKLKLEQDLKKRVADENRAATTANVQMDNEFKKQQQLNQSLEVQLRENNLKLKEVEKRLIEAQKVAKLSTPGVDEPVKGKMAHLESSVKKLTADLMASQNQTAEIKKEVNKVRSEKQALENQLAASKKELEKLKPASPKTPGSGGKAA